MESWLIWLLGILGTIVLGALGSGLWDTLLKPMFRWLGNTILRISLTVFRSSRDNLYAEAARGRRDRSGLFLLLLIISTLLCVGAFLLGFLKGSDMANKHIMAMQLKGIPSAELAQLIGREADQIGKWLMIFYSLAWVILAVFLLLQYLRISYIESVVTLFEQYRYICFPYMNDSDIAKLQSKFAQMKCKRDFIDIFNEFERVAVEYNLYLPGFVII